MTRTIVVDDGYKWERFVAQAGDRTLAELNNIRGDHQILLGLASATPKIPMEVVHLNAGQLASLPRSYRGKTSIVYAGDAPQAVVEPDQYGNVQVSMRRGSVLEVVYNVEKPNHQGFEGKKKIYICE